ncbi:MAG: PhzF family phenazine biosynthesis protein [Sphingobacteriales bacterium]|nr:PhzF family phenazine biosynthesis protein [Sphingobacteriales bacterium]OJY84286.1 MAG: isomerase [Sphingobacteriales bacterium 44-15]
MIIPIYQADAFTEKLFGGNPAAVCPLEEWLPDTTMQNIAMENNLAETAFIVKENDQYHIRWFTPAVEVALCGHATLAAAHIYMNQLGHNEPQITFNSKSGLLKVIRQHDKKLTLDFPADRYNRVQSIPPAVTEGLKVAVSELYKGSFDYMAVVADQKTVEELIPDFKTIATLPSRGIIVTATGDASDFVSRGFFPQSGIDEDPVTGSAHTLLVPYWSGQLHKQRMTAIQLSARRGYLECQLAGDRVLMSGYAVTYLQGTINI